MQLLAGQGATLETFVVPVGDPDMKLEWFLNKEPLLFKSSFTPVYDYGFVALSITKVYPDDFGFDFGSVLRSSIKANVRSSVHPPVRSKLD